MADLLDRFWVSDHDRWDLFVCAFFCAGILCDSVYHVCLDVLSEGEKWGDCDLYCAQAYFTEI